MTRTVYGMIVLLLAALSVSVFAAGGSETAGTAAVGVSEPGQFPITKEKVTLKFFAPQHPFVEDMATNAMTKYMEDLTNVHVEWETVPLSAIAEKRTLVLASGTYPDVLFSAQTTREEEMQYGPAGLSSR